MMISIPLDKQQKAVRLLNNFDGKRKATVKELQVLTGYLNFLSRAIFAGRAFTRRIYAKYSQAAGKLKKYHHINLDREFRFDLDVWRIFLTHHQSRAVCRPMVDLDRFVTSQELVFYLDASAKGHPRFLSHIQQKMDLGTMGTRLHRQLQTFYQILGVICFNCCNFNVEPRGRSERQ